METKAHYAAVGGFVLAAAVALVVVLLWFAGAQYRQEFTYYETDFTGSVTGLGQGTSVRYNGIEVGHVNELKFDPNDPKIVRVILEIQGGLPIHSDAVASIESQGLAGGSYVLITGGSKDTPLLTRGKDQRYPIIKSKPSSLEQLFADTPLLMARLNVVADRFGKLLDEENRDAFKQILLNVRDTTGAVGKHNADIEATLAQLNTATRELNSGVAARRFGGRPYRPAGDQPEHDRRQFAGPAFAADRARRRATDPTDFRGAHTGCESYASLQFARAQSLPVADGRRPRRIQTTMTTIANGVNRRGLLLAGGAMLVLAGCGSTQRPPQIYVLKADLPKGWPGSKVNWSLSVATPYAAASLNIDRIALTRSSATLDYFADAQWTDRLPIVLQSAMVEAFQASGRIAQVSRDVEGLHSDYVLETEIRDFAAHYNGTDSQPPNVAVRIAVNFVKLPERTIVRTLDLQQQATAAENNIPAVAAAFNAALTLALKQIVDWTLSGKSPGEETPHERRRQRRQRRRRHG